eukprot:g2282.t1
MNVEGTSYLQRDFAVACYQGEWNDMLPVAVVFIGLYAVGIPLWFVQLQRGSGNAEIKQLLSGPYRADWPFTEQFIMLFKAWLWVIAVFLSSSCMTQTLVATFFCLAGLLFTVHAHPFRQRVQNVLLGIVMFTFTCIALLGLVLQTQDDSAACNVLQRDAVGSVTTAVTIIAVVALGSATLVLVWKVWARHLLTRPQVMVSYRHEDAEIAGRLAAALKTAGFRVWIDTEIRAGNDWRSDIADGIRNSVAVVFVMTPAAIASKYCKEELYYARMSGVPIFPVMIQDTFSHLRGGVKLILQRIQWIDFTDETEFKDKFRILKQRLRKRVQDQRARAVQAGIRGNGSKGPGRNGKPKKQRRSTGHSDVFVCFAPADSAVAQKVDSCVTAMKMSISTTNMRAASGRTASGRAGESHERPSLFDVNDTELSGASVCLAVVSDAFAADEQCKELLHAAHELDKPLGIVTASDVVLDGVRKRGANSSVGLILSSGWR